MIMSSYIRTIHRRILRKSPEWAGNASSFRMNKDGGYSVYRPTKGWLRVGPLRARHFSVEGAR